MISNVPRATPRARSVVYWTWWLALASACEVIADEPTDAGADTASAIDADQDGSPAGLDCDDADPSVFPENPELCDGLDQDCDGEIDEGFATVEYYSDPDDDGYGSASGEPTFACAAPPGFVAGDDDCDDTDPQIHPGAARRCDVYDADCDQFRDADFLVPTELPTVQAAVDAASDGDLLCLEPSLPAASGPFVLLGKVLTVGATAEGVVIHGAGARAIEVEDATLDLSDVTVTGDHGGLRAEDAVLVLDAVTFDGVVCDGTTTDCEGAAFAVDGGQLTVRDVIVVGTTNVLTATGGAVSLRDTDADVDGLIISDSLVSGPNPNGGALFFNDTTLVATHVSLLDNVVAAGGSNGAGAYFFGGTYTLANWVVAGNRAVTQESTADGAGLHFSASGTTATLDNVAVVGNVAIGESCEGSGIYVGGGATVSIRSSTIEANEAECTVLGVGGVAVSASDVTVSFTNVHGNLGEAWSGIADPAGTDGNTSVDGALVSLTPGAWDLHLGAGSPLIDAGDPAVLDPDGTTADVGAYGGPAGAW